MIKSRRSRGKNVEKTVSSKKPKSKNLAKGKRENAPTRKEIAGIRNRPKSTWARGQGDAAVSSSVEVTFNTTTMEAPLAQKGDLVSASGRSLVRLLQGGKREIVWDRNSESLCPYIASKTSARHRFDMSSTPRQINSD